MSHKNTQYKQLVMLPLSMPLRHLGVVEVWLHLFLTLALDGDQPHVLDALPLEKSPNTHIIGC
jgi:hypothetical protein